MEEAGRIAVELVGSEYLLRRLDHAGAKELLARDSRARAAYLCPHCASPMILGRTRHGWWLHCPSYYKGRKGRRDLGVDPRRALEQLPAGGHVSHVRTDFSTTFTTM